MIELLDIVELTVDNTGEVILPKEVQESLEPGTAFIVETRHNGTIVVQLLEPTSVNNE